MMVTHHLATPFDRHPVTETALCAWVGQASPGDTFAYHRGYLAIDTGVDSTFSTGLARKELRRVARRAWQLAQAGGVHLVQRRHGDADYSYLVVARHRPRKASGAFEVALAKAGLAGMRGAA